MVLDKIKKLISYIENKLKESNESIENVKKEKNFEKKVKKLFVEYIKYKGIKEEDAKKIVDKWFKENREKILKAFEKLKDIIPEVTD